MAGSYKEQLLSRAFFFTIVAALTVVPLSHRSPSDLETHAEEARQV